MRYMQFVIGVILLIKGIKEVIALPAAASSIHVGSAYTAGEMTGLVVGTLAVVVGGGVLVTRGWREMRGRRPLS